MPLTRLDRCPIRTEHLAETEQFYTTVLGLSTGGTGLPINPLAIKQWHAS